METTVACCVCKPGKSFRPAKILRSGPSSTGPFYRKKKDIANGSSQKKIDNKDPANIILTLITSIYVGPAPPAYRQAGEQALRWGGWGTHPTIFCLVTIDLEDHNPW